ncbi:MULTISPECIES: helix-turn-helix domain-containing protein [Cupriavidus]
MDHLKTETMEEVRALVARYPNAPSLMLATAQWASKDTGCAIIARRFADPGVTPLSGRDLKAMRINLLALSQDEVAERFRISRNSVSRMENFTQQDLDGKSTYAYFGLVFVHYILPRMLKEGVTA